MFSLCSLPSQINVWHKLVHLLTFPLRFRPWTGPYSLDTGPSPTTDPGENVPAGPPAALWSPSAEAASGLLLINTRPQCQHQGGGSNADPSEGRGGVIILVGPVALTRLLSYSFLEAAKSWALEIAMPQKGRYICNTCGHSKHIIGEKQNDLSTMVPHKIAANTLRL